MILIVPPLDERQIIKLDIGVFADDDAPPTPQEVVQNLTQRQLIHQMLYLGLEPFLLPQGLKIGPEISMANFLSNHIRLNQSNLFMEIFRLEDGEGEIGWFGHVIVEL